MSNEVKSIKDCVEILESIYNKKSITDEDIVRLHNVFQFVSIEAPDLANDDDISNIKTILRDMKIDQIL